MLHGKYPLLIALVLGVMAGTIAYSAMKSRDDASRRYWAPARILCAAQDIEEGAELDENMLDVCETPARYLTESVIRVPDEETKDSLIPYGQKLLVPIKKGDALLYSQFQAAQSFPLSGAVPKWARAISIDVSDKASVGHHIQPNDHVDVLATLRDPEGKEPFTMTLLMNEIVLAAGGATGQTGVRSEEDRRYTHVTLMVSPREAEMLTLAQEIGSISLVLRNPDSEADQKELATITNFQTLLTEEKALYGPRMRNQTVVRVGPTVCHGNDCRPEPAIPSDNLPKRPM